MISTQSKSSNLLFRFTVHTTDSKANVNYGNLSLKNDDGTAKVFNSLNVGGIALPFDDPCPTPWTGAASPTSARPCSAIP